MSSQLNNYKSFTYLSLDDSLCAYRLSQAIFSLYHLKIPEYLQQQGSQNSLQLAQALKVDYVILEHLLEIAITLNLIEKDEQNYYKLSSEGLRLCPDTPNSVIPILTHHDYGYKAWGELTNSLRTGKTAFEQVYEQDIFSYFRQNSEQNLLFNRFMEQTTQAWLATLEVEKNYKFSGHVIDIGGNIGALSALLLQQFPELQATVFDLEQAMVGAENLLSNAGVSERCSLVTGSFFEPETIPKNGDIYLISRVLLNWNDEKVKQILKNCYNVMPSESKLLILDFILFDTISTSELLASLNLWVMFGAIFRRKHEFEQLLQESGFTSLRWIHLNEMIFFLEAIPA